jgi:hypothetical protein
LRYSALGLHDGRVRVYAFPNQVIALGISPGLRALGYAVLHINGAPRAELLDSDVLHAGRGINVQNAIDVARRVHAHRLVLDVVLDRNRPAVVVLAPQADPREPPEHIALVRLGLMALGQAFHVPILDLHDPVALYAALGIAGSKAMASTLRSAVRGPSAVSRDRRVLLATAAAVAGGRQAA